MKYPEIVWKVQTENGAFTYVLSELCFTFAHPRNQEVHSGNTQYLNIVTDEFNLRCLFPIEAPLLRGTAYILKTGPEAGQYFHVRPPIGFI